MSKPTLLLLDLTALFVFVVTSAVTLAPRIDQRLAERVEATLGGAGLEGLAAVGRARTIELHGTVGDRAARERALALADAVPGVRAVADRMEVPAIAPDDGNPLPVEAWVEIRSSSEGVTISGRLAGAGTVEAIRRAVAEIAAGRTVATDVAIDRRMGPVWWVAPLEASIVAIAPLVDDSVVRVSSRGLEVAGRVPNRETARRAQRLVAALWPSGWFVSALEVGPVVGGAEDGS